MVFWAFSVQNGVRKGICGNGEDLDDLHSVIPAAPRGPEGANCPGFRTNLSLSCPCWGYGLSRGQWPLKGDWCQPCWQPWPWTGTSVPQPGPALGTCSSSQAGHCTAPTPLSQPHTCKGTQPTRFLWSISTGKWDFLAQRWCLTDLSMRYPRMGLPPSSLGATQERTKQSLFTSWHFTLRGDPGAPAVSAAASVKHQVRVLRFCSFLFHDFHWVA